MQYGFDPVVFSQIVRRAQEAGTYEVVGWICGRSILDAEEPTILWYDWGEFENHHPCPEKCFTINGNEIADRLEWTVTHPGAPRHLGLWHSHPEHCPSPGMTDLSLMRMIRPMPFLIVSVRDAVIAQWELNDKLLPMITSMFCGDVPALVAPVSRWQRLLSWIRGVR